MCVCVCVCLCVCTVGSSVCAYGLTGVVYQYMRESVVFCIGMCALGRVRGPLCFFHSFVVECTVYSNSLTIQSRFQCTQLTYRSTQSCTNALTQPHDIVITPHSHLTSITVPYPHIPMQVFIGIYVAPSESLWMGSASSSSVFAAKDKILEHVRRIEVMATCT